MYYRKYIFTYMYDFCWEDSLLRLDNLTRCEILCVLYPIKQGKKTSKHSYLGKETLWNVGKRIVQDCFIWHYLFWQKILTDLNVHQGRNGQISCGIYFLLFLKPLNWSIVYICRTKRKQECPWLKAGALVDWSCHNKVPQTG